MIKRLKFKLWYWKFAITSRVNALGTCIKAMKPYRPLKKVESTPEHTEAMMAYFFNEQERAIEKLRVDKLVHTIDVLIAEYTDRVGASPKYVIVNTEVLCLMMEYGVNDIWPEVEMVASNLVGYEIEVVGKLNG